MRKENRLNNVKHSALLTKDEAYAKAKEFWKNNDLTNAEAWAIKAMHLGSKKLAPQLLAEITEKTQSKHSAITLASFYWDQKISDSAVHWASLAKKYGSVNLADKLISEIEAHLAAIEIHNEVGRLSK
jgi:hypothetical protein